MPSLHVLRDHRTVAVTAGQTILQATLAHGIPHAHACGGQAKCSTYRVVVLEGLDFYSPHNATEQELDPKLLLSAHVCLACQTTRS